MESFSSSPPLLFELRKRSLGTTQTRYFCIIRPGPGRSPHSAALSKQKQTHNFEEVQAHVCQFSHPAKVLLHLPVSVPRFFLAYA